MKNILQAGFARIDITPPLGVNVAGYFIPRIADGILDSLEVNALALSLNDKKVLFICADLLGISNELYNEITEMIAEETGVPTNAVFLGATHTHTGPEIENTSNELTDNYIYTLKRKTVDAAKLALADLKNAKMGYGIGQAPNVAFVRRFRMKDGSVRTNPGVNNPDIVAPIGDMDERVSVVRFDRENAETLIFASFANHPDVVGGCKISGDWPALFRRTVEKAIDNTKCIFFNGAQGDVNHVNVHPTKGDFNDMFMDFDDVSRGYGHARYIARVVTGGVLQCYDKVTYVDVDSIKYIRKTVSVPSNMPTPEEVPEAIRINDLHLAGKDDELPYTGMMLTTVVAEAGRMVRLKDGPEAFDMNFCGIALGPVAFVSIPGEGFNAIGKGFKDTDGYGLIIPCGLTNGYEGYFPMQDSYEEGGYEARSSRFKKGTAELIIEEGKKILKELETL
ncbi:MAG: hypothetical protein E7587_06340 [Ruminococcaceae bacterium]|nr:hypothetical protein [Oscillospiraceae bacterium]